MNVIERMAEAIHDELYDGPYDNAGNYHTRQAARAAVAVLRDAFVDPAVRAAVDLVLLERD